MKKRKAATDAVIEVVRRPRSERKRLPAHLEAFARSDETKLRMPRAPRREDFPAKPGRLIPGVTNPDGRVVYDARVAAMRAALSSGNGELADRLLAQAVMLGLWRAKNVMGFDAFAEDVLGLRTSEARARAHRGGEAMGIADLSPVGEETVAAWMRAEAALVPDVPGAIVELEGLGRDAMLVIRLPITRAVTGFAALGTRGPRPAISLSERDDMPGRDDRGPPREPRSFDRPPPRDRDRGPPRDRDRGPPRDRDRGPPRRR